MSTKPKLVVKDLVNALKLMHRSCYSQKKTVKPACYNGTGTMFSIAIELAAAIDHLCCFRSGLSYGNKMSEV